MSKNSTTVEVYELGKNRTIRDCVLARLEELGMSKYELAHHADLDIAPTTVYRFLNDKSDSKIDIVEQILVVLGMSLCV